jgi:transcriptional antiterminator NusG
MERSPVTDEIENPMPDENVPQDEGEADIASPEPSATAAFEEVDERGPGSTPDDAEPQESPDAPAADAEPAAEPPVLDEAPVGDASPELVAAVEEAFESAPETEGETEGETEERAEPDLGWQPGDWYVVHTYAGYENKVKADLESRVASMNMEDSIFEVVIPMEEVMEIKGGKKQMIPRKVFPGYLLVRMDLNDDSWYVVRNTPGVTGFVGSGTKPIPLSEREVDKILRRKGEPAAPKPTVAWQAGDNVRVTTGPFANFQGSISDVDAERQKVKVLVNIFGRETPVELSFDQIAKV